MKPLPRAFTVLSLGALIAGFALGMVAHSFGIAWLSATARALAPLGTLWTNALQMVVIPLVLVNLLLAVAGGPDGRTVGRLGGGALVVFVLLLLAGGLFTALVVPAVLARMPAGSLSLGTPIPSSAAAAPAAPTLGDWLLGLVPVNPVAAAARGELLPLIVFTVLFALGLTQVKAELKRTVLDPLRAVSEAIYVMLRWILWFTPAGVFCLAFAVAAETGPASAGAVGFFVALVIGLLIAGTAALYLVAWLFGGIAIPRFARAVAPAQMVAVSTRSSLASLPALLMGAEQRLALPRPVTSLVLPLAVATFKINRTFSSTAKLLFLAHVYGIHLEPVQIATFVVTVLLLSFTTPGIPSTGSMVTLPVYLSFGIPIEGVLILNAVDAAPDVFKTLANVTADMTAATVVARHVGTTTVAEVAGTEARSA